MHFSILLAVGVALASLANAHPGADVARELAERKAQMQGLPRNLLHCAEKLEARGITADAAKRRARVAREAREARGLPVDAPYLKIRADGGLERRTAEEVLAKNHESPVKYTPDTSEAILFAGNSSCVLSPEVTEGPYYIANEYVRSDVTDGQKGVVVVLDTQVIDIKTCLPVPTALVEIWQCNSTGVYGGVVVANNGAGTKDPSNKFNPALRGLQKTDPSGVAQFTTLFPGHYTGRTTHIHVSAHLKTTVLANGHYSGGTTAHVGQLFFDQSLITKVEATAPYTSNTQALTTNAKDGIFLQEAASSDPVVEYSLLGSKVTDGIFGWIAFGIDTSVSKTPRPAGTLAATVTVTNAGQQVTGKP